MGQAHLIECNSCAHKIWVYEGIGIIEMIATRTLPFEFSEEFLSVFEEYPKIIKDTKEWVEKNDVQTSVSRHRYYHCKACDLTNNRFWFRFQSVGNIFEPTYFCESCKGSLDLLENEEILTLIEEITKTYSVIGCPECRGHNFIDAYNDKICIDYD